MSYYVIFQPSCEMLHCIDNASIQSDIQKVHLTIKTVKTVFSSKFFNISRTSFFSRTVCPGRCVEFLLCLVSIVKPG